MDLLGLAPGLYANTSLLRRRHRLFQLLFNGLPYRSSRSYYGVRLVKKSRDHTYRFGLLGAYGDFISDRLTKFDRPFLFLDIGANQGLYSLIAAANRQCVKGVAFEPNPHTFAYLVQNLALNDARSVIPICAAIAPVGPDIFQFSVPSGHSGAANMFGRGDDRFTAFPIETRSLKALLERPRGTAIVCKIDVEGAEPLVLRALADAGVLTEIDQVIVEINEPLGSDDHSATVKVLLHDAGLHQTARSQDGSHFDAVFERG